MRDITAALMQSLADGRDIVYCRLVETRGSTPQKAGAIMLVYADGSQAGTLGGGCVEAEVKRRALDVLHHGRSQIASFQLDNDYGWDDGLICGGRMHILLQPVTTSAVRAYYQQLVDLVQQQRGLTEAVVFTEDAGLPAAACLLFDGEQQLCSSLGLDGLPTAQPPQAAAALRPLSERPRPYFQSGIAFLPSQPRCRLIIVGGGHVGQAVAELAATLEFDVWVVDDRPEYVSEQRFPRAERRIAGDIDQVLPELDVTPNTYCLIVTRGHHHDEKALYYLAERPARYVGLIGSRRKIRMIFDDLLQEGISSAALDRVYAPLGIDIGSQTVPEIAVSICAELIAHRNLDGKVPGRPSKIAVAQPSPSRAGECS